MSIQPTETSIQPKFDRAEMVQHVASSYNSFIMLGANQKTVLSCIFDDFMSGVFRTDKQIAADCGIAYKTVYNVKRNGNVLAAIREILPELANAKLPEVIANAVKLSSKTYKAGEFVARFTGAYVPRSQQQNINVNLKARAQNLSPEQAIDSFLGKLMSLGWSAERIYERAKELQANLP